MNIPLLLALVLVKWMLCDVLLQFPERMYSLLFIDILSELPVHIVFCDIIAMGCHVRTQIVCFIVMVP